MPLPQDHAILLSVINTALRDQGDSLEEVCLARGYDMQELLSRLHAAGYRYDEEQNRFVAE